MKVVLRELGLKGSVAATGDDMHEALTMLRHGRINTDAFTAHVRPLGEIQAAVEELICGPDDPQDPDRDLTT